MVPCDFVFLGLLLEAHVPLQATDRHATTIVGFGLCACAIFPAVFSATTTQKRLSCSAIDLYFYLMSVPDGAVEQGVSR